MTQAHGTECVTIIVDTREQMPWAFSSAVQIEVATLPAGDYSVAGLETRVAIERKSVADLIGSLTAGRDRFFRELEKLAEYEFAAVFVEGDMIAIARGDYRSQASPASIIGSCAAIAANVGVHVCFLSNRAAASMYAEKILIRLAGIEAQRASVQGASLILKASKTATASATKTTKTKDSKESKTNGTSLPTTEGQGPR